MSQDTQHRTLRETVIVGIEQSARALSKVVGHDVQIQVPSISWRYPSSLLMDVIQRDERLAASAINLLDPVPSKVLLIYPFSSALTLYRVFCGYDDDYEFSFTEEEISFIKEITNILVGSFATAVCNHLDLERLNFGTPDYLLLTGKSLTGPKTFLKVGEGENILYVEARLTIPGMAQETHLYMMFKPDQSESILPLLHSLKSDS